jgi:lipopolysaccharide/colanic/teichoic acid biosynthesis glycosyltransferase
MDAALQSIADRARPPKSGGSIPELRAITLAVRNDRLDLYVEGRDNSVPASVRDQIGFLLFDRAMALVAVILLLPLLCLIALAVRLSSPGPVVFRQQRVGRGGRLFWCLKFRTMVVDADQRLLQLLRECPDANREWLRDHKLRNDPRITPIGKLLRKTSMDELPQFFNVLAGHMSIVGPRPITTSEIVRYGDRFVKYCSVKPGLTGLWQISGRNEIAYETRVRLDAFYASRKNFGYDLNICLRTIPAILVSRGCY